MYSRRVCYALPDKTNEINSKSMQSTLQQTDSLAKQKWLDYTAVKRRPKESSLNVGDRVLVKQTRQEKLLSKISNVQTAKPMSTNHEVTRNQTHFKSIPETAIVPKQEK